MIPLTLAPLDTAMDGEPFAWKKYSGDDSHESKREIPHERFESARKIGNRRKAFRRMLETYVPKAGYSASPQPRKSEKIKEKNSRVVLARLCVGTSKNPQEKESVRKEK
mgnify:CR=1 FL=1